MFSFWSSKPVAQAVVNTAKPMQHATTSPCACIDVRRCSCEYETITETRQVRVLRPNCYNFARASKEGLWAKNVDIPNTSGRRPLYSGDVISDKSVNASCARTYTTTECVDRAFNIKHSK